MLTGFFTLSSIGAAAAAPKGEPVLIGAILSTTGAFAPLGEPERNALLIAEQRINAGGGVAGRPLKIEIVDDEGKPDVAAQLATSLVGEHAIAIIGGTLTAPTAAILRVTQAAGIPQIFMNPTAQIWDSKNGVVKNLFETTPRNETEGAALLEFAKAKLGTKKLAVLHDENAYGAIGSVVLVDEARKRGIDVVANEDYPTTATDVTAQLLKVRDSGADSIAIWGASTACPLIVRQIRQLGLRVNVFGTTGLLSDNFLRVAGKDGEGVYSDSDINFTYPSPAQSAFLEAYHAAYHVRPANFGAFAWDAAFILAGAVRDAGGKTDGPALIAALEHMKPYAGATATIRFTPADHNGIGLHDVHIAVDRNAVWFTLRS
ncbi:MAG: ABC transporter substrate-binding protein [Candidatus Baltobacteraceae bacterium]